MAYSIKSDVPHEILHVKNLHEKATSTIKRRANSTGRTDGIVNEFSRLLGLDDLGTAALKTLGFSDV